MKVWLVMFHEGPSEDDAGSTYVERVFARESEAMAYLDEHVARTECGLERILPGSTSFHPRKVPVARCLCDEQGWSIDEWEVEET
jgi:hypothetical protein